MADHKTHAEPDKAPPPQVVDKAEEPEKDAGPARQTATRPTRPPATARAPAVARATDKVAHPETGGGADRARAMSAMQHSVGNSRVSRLVNAPPDSTADRLVQRQSAEQGGTTPRATGSAAEPVAAMSAAPSLVTPPLIQRMTATALAESWEGQETDVRWVYYNRVMSAQGEGGLTGSSAYAAKSPWYRVWLYVLGDHSHGATKLPQGIPQFKGYSTVAEFCAKNGYMRTAARARAQNAQRLVAETFAQPAKSPGAGWTGQGNLADFNNKSQPNSLYWKMARAYYWLQEDNKVAEKYVKVLQAGRHSQVIFDAHAIEQYYKQNRLPASVPLYDPPGAAPAKDKPHGKK